MTIALDPNNRVVRYAEKIQSLLDGGLKPDGSPLGDVKRLEGDLDISLMELVRYQEAKSIAQLKGLLTVDEAVTVYNALGRESGGSADNGGWGDGVTLAMKITITTLMMQILQALRR